MGQLYNLKSALLQMENKYINNGQPQQTRGETYLSIYLSIYICMYVYIHTESWKLIDDFALFVWWDPMPINPCVSPAHSILSYPIPFHSICLTLNMYVHNIHMRENVCEIESHVRALCLCLSVCLSVWTSFHGRTKQSSISLSLSSTVCFSFR